MSKQVWIDQFERLRAEFIEAHPDAPEEDADAFAGAGADEAAAEALADRIDRARDRAKYKDL